MICVLCAERATSFFIDPKSQVETFVCEECDLRFTDPSTHLPPSEEYERYRTHENNIEDPGYQKFVSPLKDLIVARRGKESTGLDYGCGDGPVLKHLLIKEGFSVALYDPYFHPDVAVLEKKYDFISATEVIEHFYHPGEEFAKLRAMLRPGGSLGLMTLIYEESIDFSSWYYRRDPTHVCFYSRKTFEWIRKRFNFQSVDYVGDRTIWFDLENVVSI